ncbi:cadherin-like beta sandwich domain-containing protein [Paenibacillus bovis]|uniref:Fibronectin type-III domain-containing protein n=1 Tax=Paenibacillus bovis TaxID=1616788 RepID=A0A172ZH88_9BACL|nr:cadherin-like beta sandwich domain-containing protein [Paenibacillus bovis]ANF97004.1 hypothetical protein AR543_13975 [Paenibacillus bovis]
MHFYKRKQLSRQIWSRTLIMIIILSLVYPAVPASVQAENTVLVNEDFGRYPSGSFTIGSGNAWGKEGAAPVVRIVKETVTGITYADIKNTSSGSSYIGQRFAAQTGGMVAEFDIRIPGQNGGSLYMMDGKINATSAAAVNTGIGSGSIQGTFSANRIAYDPSTWYRLQYVINIPGQTYKTTITDLSTGRIIAEWQEAFRNKVARISSVGFYLGRDGGTIQLANAHVTNLDLNLSNLQVKAQDFTPGLTPGFDPSVLQYQMEVPYSVNTLDIAATASDADKVQLNVGDRPATSGASIPFTLDGLSTTIPIRVISDTYTDISRTYTLNVTRLEQYPDLRYVTSEAHNGKVKIGWEETIDPTYTEAHIYQAQKNQKLKLVDTVARGTYISTIDKLKNNTTYTFVVKAAFEDGSESAGVTLQETPVQLPPLQMEYLNRGLVAIPKAGGIYVSWRLLGTDPDSIGFDLYRDGKKVNTDPIRSTTNFLDAGGNRQSTYYVQAVGGKVGPKKSETAKVWSSDHLSIPLRKPADGKTVTGEVYSYSANDATTADLDGDGQYEIILKWIPSNAKDNSQSGHTGSTLVDAYKLDGTFLWRVALGPNIRSGAHYLDMMAYDLDGDGRAEVAFRTADGTVDGQGKVIGNANARYANESGYILSGPEYFSIFEGITGRELVTENYEPARGDVASWGDSYGNRVDRFLATIAYLDGERPSLVMQRGYYTRMVLVAYDWRDGKLTKRWTFDSSTPGNEKYAGQGNHQLSVADVDNDGKDEIITGAAAIDHNGSGLWVSGLGHGDAMHVSDLNPQRLGLEEWAVQENTNAAYSADLKDVRTGRVLWGQPQLGIDVGRGLSADIDPRYPGAEMWAIDGEWNSATGGLFTASGEKIASRIPSSNFAIWWDGDLSRELLDHHFTTEPVRQGVPKIDKWDYTNERLRNLITFTGNLSNNDTKGNPALQADILGDWREELVLRNADSTELHLYSTTEQTNYRFVTLMHDAVYRLGIAWQNTGYNQPPHTGYYLGTGMEQPEPSNIRVIQWGSKS